MNLTYISLSERSQIQKATNYMIPFIQDSGKGKNIRMEKNLVVSRGYGRGQRLTTKGYYLGFFLGGCNSSVWHCDGRCMTSYTSKSKVNAIPELNEVGDKSNYTANVLI